ncbi:MAG: endonuclease Q family protein [Syntrophorhabdus sp.]
MRFIADLHIHSKYSRATSKDMSPEAIWKWAQIKGIGVVGTGDFTHPGWLKELSEKLEPTGNGLFKLRKEYESNGVHDSCKADVSFILSAEISTIYRKNDRTRKVHSLILAPDFSDAARINLALSRIGNLNSDGRPILDLDALDLLKIIKDLSPSAVFIPAHAWTPHFSVFGAVSGFDSLEECFEDYTPHIRAIETGLSSDPQMNWRLSALDTITLISNSDAHSPAKMGREANILDTNISYDSIANAVETKQGFLGTIEFFPEEGKYHHDGHRACNVSLSPEETIRHGYLCPKCGRRVTVGVLHRVEKLADRPLGYKPDNASPYSSLIPLSEVIAETLGVGVMSKAVETEYQRLIKGLGNEFSILMDVPITEITQMSSRLIGEAIGRMRSGNIHVTPGYDGEYGKVKIFELSERKEIKGQATLF